MSVLRPVVQEAFYPFSASLEGAAPGHFGVPFMYLDINGAVTTNVGNLIDSISTAQRHPWKTASGDNASPDEIAAEWTNIKSHTEMTQDGGMAYGKIATLHLDESGMRELFENTARDFAQTLAGRFPGFSQWPADAQLATLSMAWALGPNFHYPHFQAAVGDNDFETAATQSHAEDSHNDGLKPRNHANFVLLNNAAYVVANGMNPDKLYYPQDLMGKEYPYDGGGGALPVIGNLSGGLVSSLPGSLKTKIAVGVGLGSLAGIGLFAAHHFTKKA